MFTAFIGKNKGSLDAQFLKKSFKELGQLNKTYFETFSQFPHNDNISFEGTVQIGLDIIFGIVLYRLYSLSPNHSQQGFEDENFTIKKLKELQQFNETYFNTFSSFRHSKINRTFELTVQNTLHALLVTKMKPFLLLNLNQKDFDEKFIIKKFKELDKFNRTYYETFSKFSHKSLTYKEMVNQTMQNILISLMNRTIDKITQYQNKYKNIASKMSFILKKYEETITMKHIDDFKLTNTIQSSIKEIKTVNKEIMEMEIGWKDSFGKFCLLYTSPSPRDATLSRMPSSA